VAASFLGDDENAGDHQFLFGLKLKIDRAPAGEYSIAFSRESSQGNVDRGWAK